MPPLDSLTGQIQTEGHLPGMPSAAEVEKNGLSLGEMNKQLLRKVEELTLYLMAQNKTIEEQQMEIATLKNQMNIIEQEIKRKN